MSISTSNYSISVDSGQPYNHTAWHTTDDQVFDWRSNPYIVTLFRVLLVVFFVFLVRIVVHYFKMPEGISCTQPSSRKYSMGT